MVRSDYMAVYDENPDVIVGYGSDGADVQNEDIFDNLIFEKTFCTAGCYMVRSAVLFERIPREGIYWQNRAGQNWHLLIPCAYKNKAGYIDEPLYKYYIRPDSHSHRIEGDEYSSLKKRTFVYHEILYHVISDFHLLSEDEKADYLTRIELKYVMGRLNLALRYNKLEDAKMEMQALERMNVDRYPRRYCICYVVWCFEAYSYRLFVDCSVIPESAAMRTMARFESLYYGLPPISAYSDVREIYWAPYKASPLRQFPRYHKWMLSAQIVQSIPLFP